MTQFTNLRRIETNRTFEVSQKLCWYLDSHGGIWMSCDQGHWASIGDHHVAPNGEISPSIVCAHDGCTFHVWGKLVDFS